jgi:Putative phage metallopeptidase
MTDYDVSKEFSDAVEDMLSDAEVTEFNPIREQDLKIFSLLEIRENNKGEPLKVEGPPIVCRKIPPVYKALCNGQYVVVGNHDWWNHANELQQKAALHHALMSINVEIEDGEQEGEKIVKLSKRKPDVVAHTETISRYGAWNDTLIHFKDAFKRSAKQFAENLVQKA